MNNAKVEFCVKTFSSLWHVRNWLGFMGNALRFAISNRDYSAARHPLSQIGGDVCNLSLQCFRGDIVFEYTYAVNLLV